MATMNSLGTRFQCPCGEWIGLTLTVGETRTRGDGSVELPISFDKDQFVQDFSTHVLDDPTNENHTLFVKAVHGGGGTRDDD